MKRRTLLLGTLASASPSAWAQAAGQAVIGMLLPTEAEPFVGSVRDELRRLGHVEGRTVRFEVRAAKGRSELLARHAAELVALRVDVILTTLTPAVHAAKRATGSIPIVMSSGDPVRTGLVASLSRPGGNITGVSSTAADLGGKLLSLMREAVPRTRHVGVLANTADPFTPPFLELLDAAKREAGVDLLVVGVAPDDDYGAAFATFARHPVQALIIQPSLQRARAIALAATHRLPSIAPIEAFAAEGGLLSYAASRREMYRRIAEYTDRVLKGAKPADLPVQQPTQYTLVVNLRVARALGLEIPLSVVVRADEVID